MEVSLSILFPILLGEELLEDDDCFFDRLDHTGFFNEIGVVDEVGEQGDHDGADEEPLEPAHGRPGEVVDPVCIGHLEKRMEGAGERTVFHYPGWEEAPLRIDKRIFPWRSKYGFGPGCICYRQDKYGIIPA